MPLEFEAKFINIVPEELRTKLQAQGFSCVRPWSLMRRYTYVLSEMDASDNSKWARIRDEGDKVTMTYKHAFDITRADGTEEVEITVDSFDSGAQFMEKLGFKDKLYQENFRETWVKGDMEVTLNEWPALATFAEVEGPSVEAVQTVSAELGFSYPDAIFGGVGTLYKYTNNWDLDFVRELTFAKAEELTKFMNNKVN